MIDLGTNNCRLLVAKPSPDGFQVIDAFSRIVRLGEGVGQSGQLSAAARTRAIESLKVCVEKMARRGVTRSWSIATQACRLADNGGDFVSQVRSETGLRLDIISTKEEARLAVAGCQPLLDREQKYALVFDIGGGSTELIWVEMDPEKPHAQPRIADWVSLDCGVVTLAEHHGGHEITPGLYEAMIDDVAGRLKPFSDKYGAQADNGIDLQNVQLLGTSGTVTTLAGIHLDLPRYDRRQVDGIWMDRAEMDRICQSLAEMTYEQRKAQPCVGAERADLVVAGCAILEAITRAWPTERMRVADRGLREGMLLHLMERADRENSGDGRQPRRGYAQYVVADDRRRPRRNRRRRKPNDQAQSQAQKQSRGEER